ncbi:MAG: hypothetical protein QM610_07005 [Chitinophagaceae bacterium]
MNTPQNHEQEMLYPATLCYQWLACTTPQVGEPKRWVGFPDAEASYEYNELHELVRCVGSYPEWGGQSTKKWNWWNTDTIPYGQYGHLPQKDGHLLSHYTKDRSTTDLSYDEEQNLICVVTTWLPGSAPKSLNFNVDNGLVRRMRIDFYDGHPSPFSALRGCRLLKPPPFPALRDYLSEFASYVQVDFGEIDRLWMFSQNNPRLMVVEEQDSDNVGVWKDLFQVLFSYSYNEQGYPTYICEHISADTHSYKTTQRYTYTRQ